MKLSYARLFRTAGMALGMALVLTSLATTANAGGPLPPGVPEIDPGSMASAMTLLVGGAMMLSGRSRKS